MITRTITISFTLDQNVLYAGLRQILRGLWISVVLL